MNESPISRFKEAIQATHGAKAKARGVSPVHETLHGETVWEGPVLIFELEDHPTAKRCYAWEVAGQVTCVLEAGAVKCAQDAVRASIAASKGPQGA